VKISSRWRDQKGPEGKFKLQIS